MEEDLEKYKKDCDLLELTDDELISEAKATLIDAMDRKSDGFRRPEKVALVAIENLIAENKQLKQELDSVKEIYYTKKDVENLIERNIKLEGSHGTAYNAGKAFKQHEWKEKIEKKIKEINEMIEGTYTDTTYLGENRRNICLEIKRYLQQLLQKN